MQLATPLALISGPFTHHLDHLAPLAHFLGCPLFVDDPSCFSVAKKHYPEVDIRLEEIDWKEIAKHYRTLILSTRYAGQDIAAMYEAMNITHMRMCFCPHGHSDKDIAVYEGQDVALIYGNRQQRRLKKHHNVHVIGNYRAAFYEQFRKGNKLALFPKTQKTILYAPTWADQETSTTFFQHWRELLQKLPSHYNLIIKLHPLLERHHPGDAWAALSHDGARPNIRVLLDFPEIYPLLEASDLYLGDYSAIGYDFLYFNRPMFFLAKEPVELHRCGRVVADVNDFLKHMDDPQIHLHHLRDEFYRDAFSPFA